MKLEFRYNQESLSIDVERQDGGWLVELPDGRRHAESFERISDTALRIALGDGTSVTLRAARTPRGVEVGYQGRQYVFAPAESAKPKSRGAAAESGAVSAPMPGVVAEVMVREGDAVAAFQPLAVVEAMKVMATLEAPFAGTVRRVAAAKGAQVALGEVLVEIDPAEADA